MFSSNFHQFPLSISSISLLRFSFNFLSSIFVSISFFNFLSSISFQFSLFNRLCDLFLLRLLLLTPKISVARSLVCVANFTGDVPLSLQQTTTFAGNVESNLFISNLHKRFPYFLMHQQFSTNCLTVSYLLYLYCFHLPIKWLTFKYNNKNKV